MVCLQAHFHSVAHVLHHGICITLKKQRSLQRQRQTMKASEERETGGCCLPQHSAFSFSLTMLLQRSVLESSLVLMKQDTWRGWGEVFQAHARLLTKPAVTLR